MTVRLQIDRKPVVAVVGAGGWGKNIVQTLHGIESCELRYICDLKKHILDANQKLYPSVRSTADFDQVLADREVQGVLIAVDAPYHFKLARAALDAGKHTYVEKPLTLSVEESAALVDLSKDKGLKLMVGHLLLYHPAVLLIKDMIDRGELGKILYLYSQRVNLGIVRQAENAWWSLAPHDISVALFLLSGRPASLTAAGQCFLQPRLGVEDVVFASLKFDDGTLAHFHTSWLDPLKVRSITVVGTRKMVVFDDMQPSETFLRQQS